MNFNPNDPRHRGIYEAGVRAGQQQASQAVQGIDADLRRTVAQLQQETQRQMNGTAGALRKRIDDELVRNQEYLSSVAKIAESLTIMRQGPADMERFRRPGVVRIEDIPGRRIPYTLLVDIQIDANTTSVRQSSVTISQEGPFVAVKRMAIFQSAFEFQFQNPLTDQVGRLAGRSYGRFRPIHSAGDIVDSQHAARSESIAWFLAASAGPPPAGTILPTGTLAQPSNMSSFRTMEFDGRIEMVNAGSSFPRQNTPVPSSMWTPHINAPFELGALDFFERGEVLTFLVQPSHVNNPPAGNVDGECIFPAAAAAGFNGYPFVEGQYDAHEGICTPAGVAMGDSGDDNDWEPTTTDPIARLPNGIFTIGFEGFRIVQTVGPVP